MKSFTEEEIKLLNRRFRANLINSCTGFKSANLIATVNSKGLANVAIFSSVIHLGAHPPLYGFVVRPPSVPRHTYANIKQSGYYTLNAFTNTTIQDAHHTSAKYLAHESEFDFTKLVAEYKNDFVAPFVKGSPIQLGMKYVNEYPIIENDTILIIGEIIQLHIVKQMLGEDGFVNLTKKDVVAINGLDAYATPKGLQREVYAKPKNSKL